MQTDTINRTRYNSYLFALSNCVLGCALGFFYGHVTLETITVAITIVLSGLGIQALCNYSIDYSHAYRNHQKDKLKGILSPIMIGELPVAALRKKMAFVTIFSTLSGAIAIYLSLGSNIQILSWFMFLCVCSVLLTFCYTTSSLYALKGLIAIAIFLFFGIASVIGAQFLIVAASHETIDIYPDTYLLAFSSGSCSLMVLYGRTVRRFFSEKHSKKEPLKRDSFVVNFGYNVTTLYLVGLLGFNFVTSVSACVYSHKPIEALLLLIGFVPMLYLVYTIIRKIKVTSVLKRKFNQLMVWCCVNNLVWVVILAIDYSLYY